MQKFKSVEELVNQLKPDKPIYCIRKNSILSASKFFQKKFPGKILYAVKTNPNPEIIKTLIKKNISVFERSIKKNDIEKYCEIENLKGEIGELKGKWIICWVSGPPSILSSRSPLT